MFNYQKTQRLKNTVTHNMFFTGNDGSLKGFQEAVISVSNMEKTLDFFQRVCGWKVLTESSGSAALKSLWQLGSEVDITEVVLHNEGDKEGFLRLVQFHNVEQERIRSGASAWDAGGIFDINMRIHDMDSWYRLCQDEGWHGYADPLRYTFGPFDVSEVLMKGPDGITVAFMQRFSPPLEGYDHMKTTSRIFNSSMIVSDIEVSRKFYEEQLGFKMNFQTAGDQRIGTDNVLGFPQNTNKNITVPIDIVKPSEDNFGTIEYLEPKEFKGKNCAAFAHPPNLGILMLRFPVRDAEAYAEELISRGLAIHSGIVEVDIAPYGMAKVFSVRSPDGVWLEFMQLKTDTI